MKHKTEKIPIGINILSIIYFISIAFSLIIAGLFFFYPAPLSNLPGFNLETTNLVSYILASFMILFAGLSYYIARGLRRKDILARNILIAISIINIIGGIISIIKAYDYLSGINITLNMIVILYLFLNKKAKNYFRR